MPDQPGQRKRRWRFYRTAAGQTPVREFIIQLSLDDQVAVASAMKDAEQDTFQVARHLREDIYEIRASGPTQSFRLLFALEGHYGQVLLALEAFSKKTQKTPPQEIARAEAHLKDWRQRSQKP